MIQIKDIPRPDETFEPTQSRAVSMEYCRKAQECYDRGDMRGHEEWMDNVPLDPWLAMGILRAMGKKHVRERIKKEHLVDAEKFYGSDWVERYAGYL